MADDNNDEVKPVNEVPTEIKTKQTVIEKIASVLDIRKVFEQRVARHEQSGRQDALDAAALEVLDELDIIVDLQSSRVKKNLEEAPAMVTEILDRVGLTEGQTEILAPLTEGSGNLRKRMRAVVDLTKAKLKALRDSSKKT